MALFQIQIPIGVPLYDLRVNLGGSEFSLRFDYSEKEDRWYVAVRDANDAPVVSGRKVVPNTNLLATATGENRPRGLLFVNGPAVAPGFAELGRTHFLFWAPSADPEAPTFQATNPGV